MNKVDKMGLSLRYGMLVVFIAVMLAQSFWPPDMIPHPMPPEPDPTPTEAITR